MNNKLVRIPDQEAARSEGMSLKEKRELAKIGMVASMGTLFVTGFMGREASKLHIGSGLALMGFSYWHYKLYQR